MRCVGSGAVLLKPNVAEITSFNFRHQIVGYHGTITVAIDGYVLTGIIFEEIWTDDSTGPQTTPNRCFFWMKLQLLNLFRLLFVTNVEILLVYIPIEPEMGLIGVENT